MARHALPLVSFVARKSDHNQLQLEPPHPTRCRRTLPRHPSGAGSEAAHLFCGDRDDPLSSNLHHALLASLWITAHQAIQLGLHLRGDPCSQSLELFKRRHQHSAALTLF